MTEQAPQENVQAAPQPNQAPASSFSVPEAYASKGWAKDIKSADDLWKLTDNAQSLIGKRPAGVPLTDSPTEEWEKFYSTTRPEKYDLPKVEGFDEKVLAEFSPIAEKLFSKHGLTQKQAADFYKDYLLLEKEAENNSSLADDKVYSELTAKHFGDKASEIETVAQEAIKAFVPEELRGAISDASSNVLVAMQALAANAKAEIDRVKKEYGAEGTLPSGESAPASNIEATRKELAALRLSKDATDPTSPRYKETRAKIEEMSAAVRRALGA